MRGERQTHGVHFEMTMGYRNALTARLSVIPPGNTICVPGADYYGVKQNKQGYNNMLGDLWASPTTSAKKGYLLEVL